MATMTAAKEQLTRHEKAALGTLETTIERGLQTFYDVGSALAKIRDGRLYRAMYGTFEEYCRQRWSLQERRAYQLMTAASVVDDLKSCTIVQLPTNEAQARVIAQIEPDQRPEVWQTIVESAPNGKVTAAHIERVINQKYSPASTSPGRLSAMMSSESEEWYTPPHIIARVEEFFDVIDLDPCSNSKTTPNVPARLHYTIIDDGLSQRWDGRAYVNPPYGDEIGEWIAKMLREYRSKHIEGAVALLPARTDTAWFSELWPYHLCFLRGRLTFVNAPAGAPFPSVLAYIGTDIGGFTRWFGDLGHIVRGAHGTT